MNNRIDNNVDVDFVEINEENKNKKYIIVCILYVIVVILSIFLILGIKNQKELVKDNINKNTPETKEDTQKQDMEQKENLNQQQNSNLIEDANSAVQDTNEQIEENYESYTNILNEIE